MLDVHAGDSILQAMHLVEKVSFSVGTTSWIWGGCVLDIYRGEFVRQHDDLDCLTLHLHRHVPALSRLFIASGWETELLSNGDLRIRQGSLRMHFGHIEGESEARWRHDGEKGSLFFPWSYLPLEPVPFYESEVHVVAPEFQYLLKLHPELLNAVWVPRPKDVADRLGLVTILRSRGVSIDSLCQTIRSESCTRGNIPHGASI